MAKVTMVCGMLLTILGFVCFVFATQLGAERRSMTALIPMFFGVPLMLLGWYSLFKPHLRMHLIHAAVTLALLGFLGSFPMGVIGLIRKGFLLAPVAQVIMGIICGSYVALCVQSFISARRARQGLTPLERP